MASPDFAATTVISERLINSCLNTYLANLVKPRTGSISLPIPQIIAGTPQTVVFEAEFFVISVQATLRPNAHGLVRLDFRCYADATVTAFGPLDLQACLSQALLWRLCLLRAPMCRWSPKSLAINSS